MLIQIEKLQIYNAKWKRKLVFYSENILQFIREYMLLLVCKQTTARDNFL